MGGDPAKFIMTTAEYAEKVKSNAFDYPWIDSKGMCKKLSYDELIKMRQDYFFKK